jgi:hypothetical protein
MKASRLIDLVHGGKRARVAWRSLRKQMDADLERHLRHRGRWPAIRELLDYAIDRESSEVVDAHLLTAAHLLRKLAKESDHPTARASCRGMSAAILIRLGKADAARKPVEQSLDGLRNALADDLRPPRAARRYLDHADEQYRRRYLGNEVLALSRYLGEELIVLDGGASAPARRPAEKVAAPKRHSPGGRARVPSWDEILLGVTRVDDRSRRSKG